MTSGRRIAGWAASVTIVAGVAGLGASGGPLAAASSTSTMAPLTNKVVRLAGADRDATAIAISQNAFPAAGSAKAVVLARSDPNQFADALVGAALAAAKGGPLLLTPGTNLDPNTHDEIQRVLPAGGTVYALGGEGALSDTVASTLTGLGYKVVRYGGSNRFETATIVADQGLGDPTNVFEATGLDFPDALAGGAAAAHVGGAVLLTDGSSQAPETAAYLTAHPPVKTYAVGGQAAAADPSATAIFGADRYDTASQVALLIFSGPTTFGAALGTNYPDALAGAADIGARGGPLLLVAGSGPLPAPTSAFLADNAATITGGFLYGGTGAVGDDVLGELDAAVG